MNGSNFYCGNSSNGLCKLALSSEIPSVAPYVHPSEKQCNYIYTHPTSKQCSWDPSSEGYLKKSDIHIGKYTLDSMDVGSTITFGKHQVNSETPWDIEWEIVDKNHSGYPSGAVTLMTSTIIDVRAFDAKEPDNPDRIYRAHRGNNSYRYSNLRLWLNSSSRSWYSSQHSYDAPPSTSESVGNYNTQYQSRPGFLYNFTSDERNLILSTSLTTSKTEDDGRGTYSTTDKVFLPSTTELGKSNDTGYSEGVKFASFTISPILNENARMNTSWTSKPSEPNSRINYWLRTPDYGRPDKAYIILAGGSESGSSCYNGYVGVRPCINLPGSTPIFRIMDYAEIIYE